jgi:hypothetical protein
MHCRQIIAHCAARSGNKLAVTFLFVATALLAGCTAIARDMAITELPTYSATAAAWGKPAPGQGRVVVLYPRLPAGGFGPIAGAGGGEGLVTLTMDDGKYTTHVPDEIFVFIDVPAGAHTVSTKLYGGGIIGQTMMADTQRTSFTLAPGETKYLKVVNTQLERAPPVLVGRAEAEAALAGMRHRWKTPLPFNQQTDPTPAFHI